MIKIEHINKFYGSNQVLNDLTLELLPHQSVALIGPNGSGKSTLMKCILGQVFANTGTITVGGQDVKGHESYRSRIGYMPQIVHFPENIKVQQLFSMLKDLRNQKAIDEELIDRFQIHAFMNKRLSALSGGMRQKVNAALAFLFNPDILILDEPTAGLDPLSAEILKEKIKTEKEHGKLILISSHILADLEEITTHILYLMDGNVQFFKSLESLIAETDTQNLSKALAKIIQQEQPEHATH